MIGSMISRMDHDPIKKIKGQLIMINTLQQTIANHRELAFWLSVVSVAMFFVAAICVPRLVVRIPSDYFVKRRTSQRSASHPVWIWLLNVAKNVFGWVLIFAGVLMLALPGQGVLTILVGLMFVDFPGKRRVEVWIVSRSVVCHSINWLRLRANRSPLELPEPAAPTSDDSPTPTDSMPRGTSHSDQHALDEEQSNQG